MAVASLSVKNPYYMAREVDWTIMRDAYGGEKYVKDKRDQYLPPTQLMQQEGMQYGQPGYIMYDAYKARAVYHEIVGPSLSAMLGVMHRKSPDIELPAKMEPLRDRATFNGESLELLLQKINEQQMLVGRHGLMADVKTGATVNELPYIVSYNTENVINWDSSKVGDNEGQRRLKFVVLNESAYTRTASLAWSQMQRYRVLAMANDMRDVWPDMPDSDTYMAGEATNKSDITSGEFITPSFAGQTLDSIPFVFIGPRDLVPEPDKPVLMPLARIALAIYRTEADYRQALYMQGQDTLVVIGQNAPIEGQQQTRVGAFGSIELPKGGDAKYVGADSGGITELGNAIQNDFKRAAQLGAQLLTERGNEAESGDALSIRVASRTATLTTVAKVGAAGLQQVLRNIAQWIGADPSKVLVNPNLDFADDAAMAQDLVYLMTGKNMGAPISKQSIHDWLAKREFTAMTYDEELKEIENEGPAEIPLGTGTRGIPGTPNALGGPAADKGGNSKDPTSKSGGGDNLGAQRANQQGSAPTTR